MENYPQPYDFSGRVVLVTGGAQGIGLAIVRAFAYSGASIAVIDIQENKAKEIAHTLCNEGAKVEVFHCDLSNAEDIVKTVSVIGAHYERIDVIVHNAAYFPLTPFADIDAAILQRTVSVNLMAPFFLTQAALPLMTRQKSGCVLVTSSVTGPRVAYPGLSHYAASKAGVNGFIRSAALELAPLGIRVNGVEPGMIRTPAMGNLGGDETNMAIAKAVPLGRLGEPEDIAQAMVFLASPSAAYITGQTIIVDGGALLPEVTL